MARPAVGVALAVWIVAVVATVFLLRAASQLLIPIVLAVLISYALEPVVSWLARHRLPRIAGSSLVMLVLLGAGAGGAYVLRDDAVQALEAVPRATQRAREAVLSRVGLGREALEQVMGESGTTSRAAPGGSDPGEGASDRAPAPFVQRAAGAIVAFAGDLVVIFFLLFFLLISGPYIRDRLIEIAGPTDERRLKTATVLDEINAQTQRYLLVLLMTAFIVGAATWVVLAWMGVRQAAVWGILAGIFNSIPYFGPVVVSGGLFVVGLAQDGGITQALRMSGAALVITSLEGWLLTPALMGRAERMNALAVFLGLLLWTWLWGAWGTVLAVPMLVVVKSVADHVELLKPLGRLMAPWSSRARG